MHYEVAGYGGEKNPGAGAIQNKEERQQKERTNEGGRRRANHARLSS